MYPLQLITEAGNYQIITFYCPECKRSRMQCNCETYEETDLRK